MERMDVGISFVYRKPRMNRLTALLCAGCFVACVPVSDSKRAAAPARAPGKPFPPEIVAAGRGKPTGYPGGGTTLLFQGRSGTDEVSVLDVVLPPHSLGAPPHLHHREDEYFYILEGEVTLLLGQEERAAPSGTHAALPRELKHGYWNGGNTPAHVLITIAPGRFGQFFLDVAEDLKKRGETDPQQIGPIIAEHARQYDCEVYLDQIGPIIEHYGLR